MIKNFTPRLYQQTILATCTEKNTLVVLPTGLGKTNIFLMLAAHRLKQYPDSKVLFLGPTRPLISQYYNMFKKHFDIDEKQMTIFTGYVKPEKREELWKSKKIIFSTPQGLENDIITNRINLQEVSLLGFDEAHRAVGNYSYVWIAQQYKKMSNMAKILALTASPGSKLETIEEVCKNLFIEAVEVRTENDPDVKPYIQEIKIKWIYVELPKPFNEIKVFLENCFKSKINQIKNLDIDIKKDFSKRDLLELQSQLRAEIISGNRQFEILRAVSVLAEAIKVQHALELLETQGIHALIEFMEDINSQSRTTKVKAVKNLVKDLHFRSALIKARTLEELNLEHPKLSELKKIVKQEILKDEAVKIIVFSQYRDSLTKIEEELRRFAKVKMFVGQQKKKGIGLSQKQQLQILKEFEEGQFNVVAMSSVGEEGLDIPSVDLVIFYEPIPSAIRTIQRRGRTGRHEEGRVIVLVTKDTRDEAYRWVAYHKEKRMYSVLDRIREKFQIKEVPKLETHDKQDIMIIADYREKSSGIIKGLIEKGVKIQLEKLDIGDYLLSSRVCVEYKTIPDFVDSIIDKRLFMQLRELKKYDCPVIVLEGEENIFAQRNIHPNAIMGMIAAITVDYSIPIISTKNWEETQLLLETIAKREQLGEDKKFTTHSMKPLTLREQQEYIVSALPGVGAVIAKPLLKKFGSVKNIVNASEKELKEVELIGDKKAQKIKEVTDSMYDN
ncbi:DEAD/DEAH box helicase [Candidatus Woesearchaeota archaeon]|nr:DEAD/DEAH box helicase [Candidatus Woesearchaeota archaeon]